MEVIDAGVVAPVADPAARTRVLSAPSLARWRDEVLAVFRAGTAKVSADGRIEAATSADGGCTWAPAAAPFEGLDDGRNHAGSHLGGGDGRGGTVRAIAARFAMAAPGQPGWDEERAGIVDADAVVAERAADGTWSRPQAIDARRHDREWAIGCGPPVCLGGTEWIQPMERHDRTDRPDWQRRYHAFALRSHDDGRSWHEEVAIPNDPTGRLAHYDQRMTVLADGRLASFAWIHDVVDDRTLPARVAWSADGGASWSEAVTTELLGGPVNPVTLADGRVLATYARRAPPAGIRVALSSDGGRTWPRADELVLYDGARRAVTGSPAPPEPARVAEAALWRSMWGWTFGSPCPLELADGSVLIAFFASDETGRSVIRSVKVRP